MSFSVYEDPQLRGASPSLLDGLTKVAATTRMNQAEDQLTEALAWLIDRSPVIATGFMDLISTGDPGLAAAVRTAESFATRTQVMLPSLGGGLLRADLSIAAPQRTLQVLVEVKLTSGFHQYSVDDVELSQPDAYVEAWSSCAPDIEASLRRVCTLTVDGDAPQPSTPVKRDGPSRGRDLTWRELADLLGQLLDSGTVEEAVRLIAQDFVSLLDDRVVPPPPPPGFLEWGADLTRATAKRLAAELPSGRTAGGFQADEKFNYAGGYVKFDTPEGAPVQFWIVATPAGSRYSPPGSETTVWLSDYNENPLPEEVEKRLLQAGFWKTKDKQGYPRILVGLPVTDISADEIEGQADQVATWARSQLRAADITAD